jgi:hypothetical protein
VIRPNAMPGPADGDYADDDEMRILRTSHDSRYFKTDNKLVFDTLNQALTDNIAHSHILKHSSSKNGREAWFDLCRYFDGSAQLSKRADSAKARLDENYFDGKSKRFGFDKFVAIETECHAELEHPDVNQGYSAREKVERMLTRVTDPRLENAKEMIESDPDKRQNLEAALAHLSTILNQKNRSKKGGGFDRNISQVASGKHKQKQRGKKRGAEETPWLSREEYRKLGKKAKKELWAKRKKEKDNEKEKEKDVVLAQLSSKLDKLEKKLDGKTDEQESDDGSSSGQFGAGAHQSKRKRKK